MTRFIPLKSNNSACPVLHIDTEAPLDYLYASADRRIRMARQLLQYLDSVEDQEVRYLANCALILLSDGCDALEAVEAHISPPPSCTFI
ncbi:hypothetical protein ACIPL1_16205 [Pseudomonas sp. NPDC090202]|uniref:hypothetical protein n=1 Tax=unclassified Pseudomonas TaxID=196821 RepID=UPI00381DEA94